MGAQIVSFKCVLKNRTGQFISSSVNRDVLTSLSDTAIPLKGLARGLQQLKKGETRHINLPAEEAYGFYDPKKVILYPRSKMADPRHLRLGQTVTLTSKSGQASTYQIRQLHKDIVQLDGNHPLAGQDLAFEIEALEVRDATPDEISAAQNPVTDQGLH